MEYRMPKKWMQRVLMIVTYTVLLVLALVKFDWILALLGQGLSRCNRFHLYRLCHRLCAQPALRLFLPEL